MSTDKTDTEQQAEDEAAANGDTNEAAIDDEVSGAVVETETLDDAGFDDLAADDADSVGESPGTEPPALTAKPGRSIVGLLALAVSIVALAGVGLVYLSREDAPEQDLDFARPAEVSAVSAEIDALRGSLAALEERIDAIAGIGDESAASRRQLQDSIAREIRGLEERLQAYDSLPPRVGNLENAVASIQGIETGARDTLLLAEAEYYLQTANTLLTFAGNVELAKTALGMADDRLVSIGNPALNNVRQAISDETTALDGVAVVDIESNAILLSSLARLADSLPVRSLDADAEVPGAESVEEPGAAGKAWNAIKEAVGDVVKVTPPGGEETPLLLPGSEPLIRSNLSLQLQAARLALLTGEQAIFEQSLDDADTWLGQYFDGRSLQVQSARETLAEVRGLQLETELPDISESLRLLRQYEALSGSAP